MRGGGVTIGRGSRSGIAGLGRSAGGEAAGWGEQEASAMAATTVATDMKVETEAEKGMKCCMVGGKPSPA
jgi:hypothetical protein